MPAIKLISEVPRHSSPQEHSELTSKTPEDFKDIPPILRYTQQDVIVTIDPPVVGLDARLTTTIYVLESTLTFMTASGTGFQIEYPKITLHGVSRKDDVSVVYCQLDDTPEGAEIPEDEDCEMSELTIYPGDLPKVEAIFEALSHCASLHPDPNAGPQDGMEDEDGAFMDANDFGLETFSGGPDEELSEIGRVRSDHDTSNRFQPY